MLKTTASPSVDQAILQAFINAAAAMLEQK